jgi:hypothetical protein
MAVRIFTNKPVGLLKEFDEKIAQKEREGSITTWQKDSNGLYTHKSERWGGKAYFKARSGFDDKIVFNVRPPKGKRVEPEVYAFYHAHLIETFLNHFTSKFSIGAATAKPTKEDNLVSKTA